MHSKSIPSIFIYLLTLALLAAPGPARAQEGIRLVGSQASYAYGQSLHIEGEFESPSALVEAQVFIHSEEQNRTDVLAAEIQDGRSVQVDLDLQAGQDFPAFSTLTYWFVIANAEDQVFESEKQDVYYEDNRFDWQELSLEGFTVRWHESDAQFGAAILAAADKGVRRMQLFLPLEAPQAVTFQVYPQAEDLRQVLQLTGYEWVAGHSDPDLDLVLLALAPGAQSSLEIERQVPHEVAHLMLAQLEGASRLPLWLEEGLASNVEVYSDPARRELLALAHASDALIPFSQLCQSFPQDRAQARLAYAQAGSFVRYLHDLTGQAGFEALVDLYLQYDDCVNASHPLLAEDLNQLQADWIAASFEGSQGVDALLAQLPWQNILISAAFAVLLFAFFRGIAKRAMEKKDE